MKRFALFTLGLALVAGACSDNQPQPLAPAPDALDASTAARRSPTIMQKQSARSSATPQSLTVQEINGMTAQQLAQTLVGPGVTISNVSYTGANRAAGTFSGGTGIIGFESGIVLSTGCISNVIGPNTDDSITCVNDTPGDPDLDELAGEETFDAAVLEFDFVPTTDRVFFQYVFSSDEYNEFVGTEFNDAFGFFVNGVNYATVGSPAVPVTINTINAGQPGVPPTNPQLYINNDPFDPNFAGETVDPANLLDTEMDGLTVVLTFEAPVTPNVVNRLKLAIADATDRAYDSNVFIQAGTLAVCIPVEIDRIWSTGTENGTISLSSFETFAAIFNVERWLPRPASPSDVRLAEGTVDESSWEEGTSAQRFFLTDLNMDGNRDVVVVFRTERLIDEGNLSLGTEQVTLWGQDPISNAVFCATTEVEVVP
jgi:hypothetical protein